MKVKLKEIKKENKIKYIDALYAALGHAQSKNEVKSLISDLLTESEQIMLGRRILIAKKLLDKRSHDQIVRELGVGLDTIFRVQKWLGGRYKSYYWLSNLLDEINDEKK